MHEQTTRQLPTVAQATSGGFLDRWLDVVWVRLPGVLRRAGSLPALAANDGSGLAAVPLLGALLPPIAFFLGLLCGAVRFGTTWSFSESLGVLALFGLVAFFGGAGPGMWLWAGYALGDFFLYRRPDIYLADWNPIEAFIRTRGAWLLLYVLLALEVIVFPLTASALRRVTPLPFARPSRAAALAEGGLYAVIGAVLTYCWAQAVPILQRPIFTWRNDTPTTVAMSPLQQHWQWVVLAVVVGALGRTAFETLTWQNAAVRDRARRFAAIIAGADRQKITWTSVPLPARLVAGAIFTTILLAGMLPGWGDGLLLLLLLVVVYLSRQFLSNLVPGWYNILNRVPLVLRLLVAAILSRILTPLILTPLWPGSSNTGLWKLLGPLLDPLRAGDNFRPILLTTLVGLIIATLLTPPPPQPRAAAVVSPAPTFPGAEVRQ
ncbi:MAG: hypothetical protein ACTHMU_24030 [Thermomicrobiales bacterium]